MKCHHRLALVTLPLSLTLDTAARSVHSLRVVTQLNELKQSEFKHERVCSLVVKTKVQIQFRFIFISLFIFHIN